MFILIYLRKSLANYYERKHGTSFESKAMLSMIISRRIMWEVQKSKRKRHF